MERACPADVPEVGEPNVRQLEPNFREWLRRLGLLRDAA